MNSFFLSKLNSSEATRYSKSNSLSLSFLKKVKLFSSSILKKFKSIAPTVAAFCVKTLKAFQLLWIKLFLKRNLFKPSKTYFPDLSSNIDSPIINIGRFDFIIF